MKVVKVVAEVANAVFLNFLTCVEQEFSLLEGINNLDKPRMLGRGLTQN